MSPLRSAIAALLVLMPIGVVACGSDDAQPTDPQSRSATGVATTGRACPPPPAYPTPDCTGVPPGTRLVTVENNVDGEAYRITGEGTIIDGKRIAGTLVITAPNVIIRNSLIEGSVVNEYSGVIYPFQIVDSTVGRTDTCDSLPAVGDGDYAAARVLVQGHGDGFRASSGRVRVEDSYVRLCSNPGDHSDGIQSYTDGAGLMFRHNTVDQRGVPDTNAPIFIGDGWRDVRVMDNLVAGGTFSIQVFDLAGPGVVSGNRVVADSWGYGPVSSECDKIDWSDNAAVVIDADYTITGIVGQLQCS